MCGIIVMTLVTYHHIDTNVWYYSNDTGNLYTNTCMIKDSNIVWYYSNDTGNLYTNTCMIKDTQYNIMW
jgi:glucan-binding YG repeat protein